MARGRRESGMATAELALVVPVVLLVLAMCLTGLGLAIDQVRCADAARVAARAASRGEPEQEVHRLAGVGAPEGSRVTLRTGRQEVTVTVTAPPRLGLPGMPRAQAGATAPREPVLAP